MDLDKKHFLALFDENRELELIMLSPELWKKVESQAGPIIDLALEELTGAAPKPEPLADYQQLLDYWDFKYPPQHEARCDCCGANSLDWRSDEPRLFRLDSANLGGLVSFVCLGCKAKVIKRHFKDHVSYDCRPFVNKD